MMKDRKAWIEIFSISAIVVFFSQSAGCGSKENPSSPIPPTNLHATAISSSEIDLTWTGNTDKRIDFCIEKKTSTFSYYLTMEIPATSYSDTNLPPATTYAYRVQAFSSAGYYSSYSNEVTATTLAPPETVITSQPSNPTNQTSAIFNFTSTDPGSTYFCKLDIGSWELCASPKSYPGPLTEGNHFFNVMAMDSGGSRDQTPAIYEWAIELTPPDTTIISQPSNPSTSNSAIFTFTCTVNGCLFECQLDAGGWNLCDSPESYTGLSEENHAFEVKAMDLAGSDLTPESYSWTIIAP